MTSSAAEHLGPCQKLQTVTRIVYIPAQKFALIQRNYFAFVMLSADMDSRREDGKADSAEVPQMEVVVMWSEWRRTEPLCHSQLPSCPTDTTWPSRFLRYTGPLTPYLQTEQLSHD